MSTQSNKEKKQITRSDLVFETCIFAMLGTIMFCSKIIMEALPNIHLLGMLTMTYTVVFRKKALIPIYIYVFMNGLFSGFSVWWVPYLYIWTILWGITMILPKNMPDKIRFVVYPLICSLHGFAFGILYSPAQALLFGFNFEQILAWIIAGFSFDIIHGISNIFAGMLVVPLSDLIVRLMRRRAN